MFVVDVCCCCGFSCLDLSLFSHTFSLDGKSGIWQTCGFWIEICPILFFGVVFDRITFVAHYTDLWPSCKVHNVNFHRFILTSLWPFLEWHMKVSTWPLLLSLHSSQISWVLSNKLSHLIFSMKMHPLWYFFTFHIQIGTEWDLFR